MSLYKKILNTLTKSGVFLLLASSLILFSPVTTTQVSAQLFPGQASICPNNGDCPLTGNSSIGTNLTSQGGVLAFILLIARFLVYIITGLSVLFLVYGGYLYVTDNGSEEKVGKAKKIIVNAIIGLVIAGLSFTIVTFVTSLLDNGNFTDIFGAATSNK